MKLFEFIPYYVLLSNILLMFNVVIGSPVPGRQKKELVLVPIQMTASRVVQGPLPLNVPPYFLQSYPHLAGNRNPQTRGPFDFVGQWIQQTPWLPLEVNVPDAFQNIGNGINQAGNSVSQFSQNVANGVTQFSQNVGNGVNQFTQNVGNGFTNWMQQIGQRVPILANIVGNRVPAENTNGQKQQQQILMMVPIRYPGGQELILANEAADAFP